MLPLRKFVAGVSALFRKKLLEQELDEELSSFIEASTQQKMRAGMTHEQALRAARIETGSTAAIQDRVHESSWESVLDSVWQDVRYGMRMLRNHPGFTAVA